jgi:hypothetical protein
MQTTNFLGILVGFAPDLKPVVYFRIMGMHEILKWPCCDAACTIESSTCESDRRLLLWQAAMRHGAALR